MATVRELVVQWGFKVDQAGLKKVERSIDDVKAVARTAAIAIAGISVALGFFLNQAGKMEQWRISFETMLGSAEKARELLEEIKDFAKATPFELPGVIESSKQLLAFGIEQEKIIPTLKSLGDVAAGLGVPLARLILNFGQVKAQAKLTGRELRDFAIAGVPLLGELAKMLNKTESEIQDLVSRGKIGFPIVEKAFRDMTQEGGRFANLMQKQAQSLFGIFSNIKDVLIQISIAIGEEILGDAKDFLNNFLQFLEKNNERIKKNVVDMMKIFVVFLKQIKTILFSLVIILKSMTRVVGGINNALKILLGTLTFLLALRISALVGNLVLMLGQLTLSIKGVGTAAIIAQAKIFAIPILIGTAVAALFLIIEDIVGFFQGKDSVTGLVVNFLEEKVPAAIAVIMKSLEPLIVMIQDIKNTIELISKGKFPNLPNLQGLLPGVSTLTAPARALGGVAKLATAGTGGGATLTVNAPVTVNGAVSPESTGIEVSRSITRAVNQSLGRMLRNTSNSIEDEGM